MKEDRSNLSLFFILLGIIVAVVVMFACIYIGGVGIITAISTNSIIAKKIILDALLILFSETIGVLSGSIFVIIAELVR